MKNIEENIYCNLKFHYVENLHWKPSHIHHSKIVNRNLFFGPVGWGYRIQLHLCRGVRLPQEYPVYGSKQSKYEASVILELLGMRGNT